MDENNIQISLEAVVDENSLDVSLQKITDSVDKVNKDKKKNKVEIGLDKNTRKEIEDIRSEFDKLKQDMKSLGDNKISKSTFQKYKTEFLQRFADIEGRLDGLQSALKDTIEQLAKVGVSVDLDNAIEQFKQLHAVVEDTAEAIEDVVKVSNGKDDLKIAVGDTNKYKETLKELRQEIKKTNQVLDDVKTEELTASYEDEDLSTLVSKYKELSKEYKKTFAAAQEAAKVYNAAPEDDYIIPEAELRKEELHLLNIAQHMSVLRDLINQIQKDSGTNLIDFNDYDKVIEYSEKTIAGMSKTKKGVNETLHELKDVTKAIYQITPVHKQAEETLEELDKAYYTSFKLSELLSNGTIDIQITTDTNKLKAELDEKVAELQAEINKKALSVPIRIGVRAESPTAKDPLKVREAEIKEIQKSEDNIVMDLGKVTDKSLQSVLKTIEASLNGFVSLAKTKLAEIFKVNLELNIPDEEIRKIEKKLMADNIAGKLDITKNIAAANESAKELAKSIEHVLGLIDKEYNAQVLATDYSKGKKTKKSAKQRAEEMFGDFGAYMLSAETLLDTIQKKVFDKHPFYLNLKISEEALANLQGEIKDLAQGDLNLTDSLIRAKALAEGIVEVLKPLDGLDINVKGTKGSVKDLSQLDGTFDAIILALQQISNAINRIETAISGNKVGKVDKELKIVSTDFSEITEKIDELISTSKTLVGNLETDIKAIHNAFKELGETIDSTLSETSIHTVVESVEKIDLSKLETGLVTVNTLLMSMQNSIDGISASIKTIDGNSFEAQWKSIALLFHSIADYTGEIDLRKSKKQAEEMLRLYKHYVDQGGTNRLNSLTTNAATLEKLQKLAGKTVGNITIADDEQLTRTRDILNDLSEVLSSITSELVQIDGLSNVNGIFKGLAVKDTTIAQLQKVPDALVSISEQLKNIDNLPYSGFVKQLQQITKNAEALKNLSSILKNSTSKINEAVEVANGGKDNRTAMDKQIKQADKVKALYEKAYNSGITEIQQPKEYADILREVESNLKRIDELSEKKVVEDNDVVLMKRLVQETKEWLDISNQVKYNNDELGKQLKEELKTVGKFQSDYNKALGNDDGAERYGQEYVDILNQIASRVDELERFKGLSIVTPDDIKSVEWINAEIQNLFHQLGKFTEQSNVSSRELSANWTKELRAFEKYDADYRKYSDKGNLTKFANNYSEQLDKIKEKLNEVRSLTEKGVHSEEDVETLKAANIQLEEMYRKLWNINGLSKNTAKSNLQNKIQKYLEKNTRLTSSMRESLAELIQQLNRVDMTEDELAKIASSFNKIQISAKLAGREGKSFFDTFSSKIKYTMAEQFARYFSFYDIIRYIREVSTTVTELNSNLIELAKVSDSSIGELYKDFKDFKDIAEETGGTINDIIKSTADWARNGYSLPDSKNLAKLSSIFQNIGDGLSESQANEYLVSILKGFNLEASQAIEIMDKINNVSNNAASSVSNIGEALERSSSSFGAAKTDLSEAVALVTSANEILQSPETVGTAFKSKFDFVYRNMHIEHI